MTRLKLLALLPLAISSVAFAAAESTGSEYMHMAGADKWEVTPMLEYHDWTVKYNGNNLFSQDKNEYTGMYYGVKGEYGINDMFSVGINLSMQNDTIKQTDTSGNSTNGSASGLNNVDLYGNGKYDLGGSMLRYGLNFAISMGNAKYDITGNGSYSEQNGGVDMTPFVGWEMAMGPGIFGLKFSYQFQLTDHKISGTGTNVSAEKGVSAESLTAFYEWMNNNWSLGLAVSYNGVNGSKLTNGSTDLTVDAGHAGVFVSVYAPIVVADNITIIPNVGFGDNGEALLGDTGVKTVNGWDLSVAARFGF